jgi:F-type H+-transporting ATPase subunit delta
MAERATLARPYAEAAFEVASESGALAQSLALWTGYLERCASVAENTEAQEAFKLPSMSPEQSVDLIVSVAGLATTEQRAFLLLLAKNKRLTLLPEVYSQFSELASQAAQVLNAEVASAFPLTDDQIASISKLLQSKYGSQVKLSVSVDPELIGGVRISVGDEVMDASVREKLSKMTVALLN